jgi:catechol 2,3-dioxygenase
LVHGGRVSAPEGTLGLRHFELVLPDSPSVEAAAERVRGAGFEGSQDADGFTVPDPSGNRVAVRSDA